MKDKLFNKFALFSSVVPKYHSILKKLLMKVYKIKLKEIKEKTRIKDTKDNTTRNIDNNIILPFLQQLCIIFNRWRMGIQCIISNLLISIHRRLICQIHSHHSCYSLQYAHIA